MPSEDVGFFRNTSEIINLAANSVQWRRGPNTSTASRTRCGRS